MLQAQIWEGQLLDMAHQALNSGVSAHTNTQANQQSLDLAYERSSDITREHSKTFYMASSLLPADKRRATRALYAFCRVSDDLVDHPTVIPNTGADRGMASSLAGNAYLISGSSFVSNIRSSGDTSSIGDTYANVDAAKQLETWRQQVIFGSYSHPAADDQPLNTLVSLAWADARRAYQIPRGYVDQLLDGLSLDLKRVRYSNFAELAQYCYGVACTVGLMSMHITGYSGREAIPYAIRLGVALQLTNILRDVGEDWRAGRLYLPLDELADFGLDESDIAAGRVDERWRSFMRYQIVRARRLYADALPGVAYLHRDGRFAIAAAGELYQAILAEIESNDYNVFLHRASVSAAGKLRRLPGIWFRSQYANPKI